MEPRAHLSVSLRRGEHRSEGREIVRATAIDEMPAEPVARRLHTHGTKQRVIVLDLRIVLHAGNHIEPLPCLVNMAGALKTSHPK